jgi:hypothetical protein
VQCYALDILGVDVKVHAIYVKQLNGNQLIVSSPFLSHLVSKIKLRVKTTVPVVDTEW